MDKSTKRKKSANDVIIGKADKDLLLVSAKNQHPFWVLFAALFFGILIVAGYKYKDLIETNTIKKAIETAAVDESCDLRQGDCTTHLSSSAKVSLSIIPRDIQILKPFTLLVKTDGVIASSARVDFVGIGMDMGFNRSTLTSDDKINFKGSGVLPICSQSKMHWEARVQLETDKGFIIAPFRFFTLR